MSTTAASLRNRTIRAVPPANRAGRGLSSPTCGSSPSPRRHGAQTWSPRSPPCSPLIRVGSADKFDAPVIKERPHESELVAGRVELKEETEKAASISGRDLDALIKSGGLNDAVHTLGGPIWANVSMLLCHWWWAAFVPSYMRIPSFVPAWMGAGNEAPFELRAALSSILIMVGIVHHAAPILHLNAGYSFDTLDKVFGLMLGVFLSVGVPCLFSSYYDIFQANEDATIWYGLIFAMFVVVGVIPELAKPLCLIKLGPTPERLALPELYKQATTEKWAWTWHVVLDGVPSLMYLATWMAMPAEARAKLMAWAF